MFLKPILLAEDEGADVLIFRRRYERCGVHNPLYVVSDGEEVVNYLDASRLNYPLPGLLFLDLKMPRMGALEVLKYLESKFPEQFPPWFLAAARTRGWLRRVTSSGQVRT